ncbi:MAG: chloride channel protein [Oligoflexales bacterium]
MIKLSKVIKSNHYKVAVAILCIGIGSGIFSYLLHKIVHIISKLIGTSEAFEFSTTLLSLGFALVSFFLSKMVFKDTHGSGIPQVKLSLVAYKGKMPRRMPFGKFITTCLTLCSGLSFGKEGPMVTISAAWGHLVAHTLRFNHQITKVLVTSGGTAGLAAAFNTPIAAVVFTIEEILGELNTKYLGTIMMTSVVASVTSFKLLGNKSTFVPVNYHFDSDWHLFLYLGLGCTMSLIGMLLVKGILIFKSLKKKYFHSNDYLFVVFAVVLAAGFSHYSPAILGDGIATINQLLKGEGSNLISSMFLFFLIKMLLIATSYSTGLSGGLFMPVLFLGAVSGSLIGLVLKELGIAPIEIGVFALLGMTSLLVAVIRAPFTAFVMLFEMTRSYALILPLMISSAAAYWISTLINNESVYESVAEYEGVHLPTHSDKECLNEMIVEECMIRSVVCLRADATVNESIPIIEKNNYSGFPVIRNNNRLIGIVNRGELKDKSESDPQCKLRNAAKYSVISIYPDQSLLVALDKMKRFEIGRLPVVSRLNDKELLGLITPEDIVNYLGLSKQEI